VLVEKQDIAAEKAVRLTRRDRDCGDLYGMLPLVKGLPVSLMDHIYRNPEMDGLISVLFEIGRSSISYQILALYPM
jgi:hypothetical protein